MKLRKILAGFLAAALTVTSVPKLTAENTAHAATTEYESPAALTAGNDMEISGSDSFGNMVARELSAVSGEQAENNGCNVFSVEIAQNMAAVSFETVRDCSLVVAVYDNEGASMIGSGYTTVTPEETETEVEINAVLPEYFYIRAYLVNSDTLRPLSTEYSSPMYTREMREFLSKTTADFDPERVLNLDDNPNTNFAVFSEDTVLVPDNGHKNVLVSADEGTLTYVFGNPDESVASLAEGDVFAYDNDGELIILKVASVSTDKKSGNVTVVGQETELEEVFEHLRIDGEANIEDAVVDNSNLEDGITFEGLVSDEDEGVISPQAIDIGGEGGVSLKYNINKIKSGSVSISADLNLKINFSVKLYISRSEMYLQTGLGYSVKVSAEFKGKVTEPFYYMLGGIVIPAVPGVNLKMTPGFAISFEGSSTISGTLSGEIGEKVTYNGIENLTKTPTFKLDGEFKAKAFIGLVFEPKLELISDKIAEAELSATAGVEITAAMKGSTDTLTSNERHDCDVCFDGKITAKFSVDASVKALDNDKLSFKMIFLDVSVPLCYFYISLTYGEFDFTKCPHKSYFTEIKVTDSMSKPLSGVNVTVDNDNSQIFVSDGEGKVKFWLSAGNHQLMFDAEGYNSKTVKLTVSNSVKKYKISLIADKEESGSDLLGNISDLFVEGASNDNDLENKVVKEVKVKEIISENGVTAAIANNGDLYMWGINSSGQLGNGTRNDNSTPLKILENVVSVRIRPYSSSAITSDGSLYMWGSKLENKLEINGNNYYDLTPQKIMDNVIYAENYHESWAIITTNGSLYMWGMNKYGRLGNGTADYIDTPTKIMTNVSEVIMSEYYTAAITTNDSLYMWGENSHGQLGNGSTENSYVPIKIMDNIDSVLLGYDCRVAAITNDKKLYMWGSIPYYSLGADMLDENLPIKIMDNVSNVELEWFDKTNTSIITTDGSLYIWGNELNKYFDIPHKIMDNVLISRTGDTSFAITKDGNLFMWGTNEDGQLGNGTNENQYVPIKIMSNVATAKSLYYTSAAITFDGDLYMWGYNYSGQLGNGTNLSSNVPIKILNNIVFIGNYQSTISAITTNGELYMWGNNKYGQLGNGTTENSSVPIKVTFPTESPTSLNPAELPIIYNSLPASPKTTFTSILPNETYNIYSVGSRTASDILSHTNLIYIGQSVSDANSTLTIPPEAAKGTVFVKAMTEFDVYNAEITSADVSGNSVTLGWNPVENAREYEVYCYTTDGICSQTKTTANTLTVDNLEKGKYYGFLVVSTVHGEQSVPAIGDVRMVIINNSLMGDVNGDQKVNDQDSILLSRHLSEWGNTIDLSSADMNGDGKVNDQDSIVLARTLAGWYD